MVNKEIYLPEGIIPNSDFREFNQFILSIKKHVNDMIFLK